MNATLAALLRDLARQLDGGSGGAEWHDAIVLQNYGALPVRPGAETPGLRGFNLLLLDRAGRPRHFAKCRPLAGEELARETALLRHIAAQPAGRRHVPAVAMGVGSSITAQLATFQPGEPLHAFLRRVGPQAAEAALLDVLAVARLLATLVPDAGAAPPAAPPAAIDLLKQAKPFLTAVAAAGFEPAGVQRLGAALSGAGPVAAAAQHGDLWPPNVVRSPDGWVLLDFEFFGQMRVPMVDASQLVRTAGDVLWPIEAPSTWIGELSLDSPRAGFTRRLLGEARQRLGLGDAAALGCAAFALLEITGRFLMAQRSAWEWQPSLHALRDYAELLDDGGRAASVMFGGAAA